MTPPGNVHAVIAAVRARVAAWDCGDNSCAFAARKGGMRTNGGCRCHNRNDTAYVLRACLLLCAYVEALEGPAPPSEPTATETPRALADGKPRKRSGEYALKGGAQ